MKLPSASCVVIALSLAFPAYGQISVQSGDDLVSGYLSKGQYDLNLLGDVSWNTAFTYASTNTNNLKINGNGHKITFGPATGVYFYFSRNNGSLAINDAVVETQTFAGVRDSLFWIGSISTGRLSRISGRRISTCMHRAITARLFRSG